MALLLSLALAPFLAKAQSESAQQRFLEARRRQIELRQEREELHRVQELDAHGLASAAEVRKAEADHDKAQLAYQQALLDLLGAQPRLTIREAVRYLGDSGEPFVRLTIANLTAALQGSEIELLESFDEAVRLPSDLRSGAVRGVAVSLRDTGAPSTGNAEPIRGATIALPFENFLGEIGHGEAKTVVFRLLRDVSTVTVHLEWAGGQQETDVHLQQAEGERPVRILSAQRSLEADLGSIATYDLRLGRSAVDVVSYRLRVVGLPRQIGVVFRDPSTNARLTQVSFGAGVQEQDVELSLFLPDNADRQLELDRPLQFWVIAGQDDDVAELSTAQAVAEQELASSPVGYAGLEITPRGVGRLEVSAVSLFSEMQVGGELDVPIEIENSGSRRVDNIRLLVEPPLGWRAAAEPALIEALDQQESQRIDVRIVAPSSAAVGEYEVRLKAEGTALDRQMNSQEKLYRISLESGRSLLASGAILAAIVLIAAALVGFGIKLTRR